MQDKSKYVDHSNLTCRPLFVNNDEASTLYRTDWTK